MTFQDVSGLQKAQLATACTLTTIGVFCTALRLYSARHRSAAFFTWNFLWIVLSLVFALACEGPAIAAVYYGMGKHTSELNLDLIERMIKLEMYGITLGILSTLFGKLAVVSLLLEIHGPLVVYRRYLLYAVASILTLIALVSFIMSWLQCSPTSKIWDILLPGDCSRRMGVVDLSFANGAVNVAVDIFLSLYPIGMMWDLKVKRKTKVAACFLMAGGAFASWACILRTQMVRKMVTDEADISYVLGKFDLYGTIELWLVIILGSLPALRPVLLRYLGSEDRDENRGNDIPMTVWTEAPSTIVATRFGDSVVRASSDESGFRFLPTMEKKASINTAMRFVFVGRASSEGHERL